MTKDEWYAQLFERLGNSRFRSRFYLKQKDFDYINEKGLETIRLHWTCPSCGTHHFRDHNAAINIKNRGFAMLPT